MNVLRPMIVTQFLFLTACGGSSGGDDTPVAPNPPSISPPTAPILTGVITPVPVGGLSFSTPSSSGATSPTGEFAYREGELITIGLGATELGTVEASPDLSVFDLRRGVALTDVRMIVNALGAPESTFTAAVNVLRLMYSLDDDQDPDTGINVTDALSGHG